MTCTCTQCGGSPAEDERSGDPEFDPPRTMRIVNGEAVCDICWKGTEQTQ